jgi:hypothetical protein
MGNETVLCSRCKSVMEPSLTVYRLPESLPSRLSDEPQTDLKKGIDIQILHCSNPECEFIELKVPKRWPLRVPSQS